MSEYVASLIESGEVKSADEWRKIITDDISDVLNQDPEARIEDVGTVIRYLDYAGLVDAEVKNG